MKPNPNCDDSFCRQRQREYQEAIKNQPVPEDTKEEEAVVHEENEWGICCVDESAAVEENLDVAKGIKLAYTTPATEESADGGQEVKTDDVSLEELMKQMKSL